MMPGVERYGVTRIEKFIGNASFRGEVSQLIRIGDEGGFFRPLHDADEIRRLSKSLGSLEAVERMGLIDHQWALVRAGQSSVGSMLDLAG